MGSGSNLIKITTYTSDFQYDSEACHLQKYSDDSAIVAWVKGGQEELEEAEEEYRGVVKSFFAWSLSSQLQLNTSKTKELVVDYRRSGPLLQPVNIDGVDVEMVETYKYLGLQLDDKLDWSACTEALYKKGQSRLYFLRRLASFGVCRKLLQMFYQSVVASVLLYAVVCWGGNIKKGDVGRLDKLVRRAGSVIGVKLDSVGTVAERRTMVKMLAIMDNPSHPLHSSFMERCSTFSARMLSVTCNTDRLKAPLC